MGKIKNIIIFLVIIALGVGIYFYMKNKSSPDVPALVSSGGTSAVADTGGDTATNQTKDFLTLLLSVKDIKLDDSIFKDPAFISLDGSHSIILTPDGTEGRPNPFAPIGSDVVTPTTPTLPLTP